METPAPSPDVPPATRLFRAVLAVSMALRARMDARLAEIGLTTQQAALLTFVTGQPAPPTQGEVARFLGTSHQNVRQLLDALARKGLVEVAADPADRRAVRIRVTEAVAALFADRDAADHDAIRGWLGSLTDAEVEVAVELLARAHRSLRSA